jgi:hypothetical protein
VITGDADALNIVRDDALELHNLVELGPGAMKDDRVKADAIEEGEGKRELVDLVEDGAADFDDRELGGMVGVRGGGEDAEVALDLLLRADRVEQARDGVLSATNSDMRGRRQSRIYVRSPCPSEQTSG